jgi:hypothetical protein
VHLALILPQGLNNKIKKHMKNLFKKENVKVGIITAIISLVVMILLDLLRYGNNIFADKEYYVLYPVWAVCLGYGGCGLSHYLRAQKDLILENHQEKAAEEKEIIWKNHKLWIFSKFLNFGFKVTLFALPVYILAYLDKSKWLISNTFWLIGLVLISGACFVFSKHLKKKHSLSL